MNRKLLLLSAIAFALSACASNAQRDTPPPVREVQVPVPVPCDVTVPDAPAFAVDALPLGADSWQQMTALRAERLQRKGYETELIAALRGCKTPPKAYQEKPP